MSNQQRGLVEERSEHKRSDSGEFDQNVDGRSGGVLERVTNSVTDDGVSVSFGVLLEDVLSTFLISRGVLGHVVSSLNVLLAVVPSSTSVGEGEGNLDTGDNVTGEES